MIPLQPYFSEIIKSSILRNFLGRQMIMEVQDRFVPCIFVEKRNRGMVGQEKIVVDKSHEMINLF